MHKGLLLIPALIVSLSAGLAAQTHGQPEDFTAFAIASDNYGSGAGTLLMSVDRWSTEAERTQLMTALREKGPRAMMRVLQDLRKAGYIRTGDALGHPVHFAYQTVGEDGGREVLLVTDRHIGFQEAWSNSRSVEYPFMVVQMDILPEGTGTGTLTPATKILTYSNILELENFTSAPIRLTSIRATVDDE